MRAQELKILRYVFFFFSQVHALGENLFGTTLLQIYYSKLFLCLKTYKHVGKT
jgi:hypothetical protein